MNNKKKALSVMLPFLILSFLSLPVFANHGGDHDGGKHQCDDCSKGGKDGGWGLEEKYYHKAGFLMSHQEEIGLSDGQIDGIKSQMNEVKKSMIQHEADIEIAAIDIKEKLHGYPVDEAGLTALIEKKYDIKKAKALEAAKAFAKLKNGLSEAQYQKMKDLWKSPSKS